MLHRLQTEVRVNGVAHPRCSVCTHAWRQRSSPNFSPDRRQHRFIARRPRICRPTTASFGSFADIGITRSVSAQTLSEVLSNKPLIQHAFHSFVSTVAWFSLAFVITRVVTNTARRFEDPEETGPPSPDQPSSKPPRTWRSIVAKFAQAALVAVHVPVAFFLPLAAVVYSLRSVAWFVGLAVTSEAKRQGSSDALVRLLERALHMLHLIDTNVASLHKLCVIVFGCWTLLRFKECMIKYFMDESMQEVSPSVMGGQVRALERVMLPVSSLASWLVVCGGSLMSLSIFGLNVKPLLTVGGVGTVLVGLSAQSVLANLVCGISLFLSRPFVVGDRVDLSTGSGERVLVGVVERVDPMRTIIRTDACAPVTIPNKVLSEMIISNESNILASRVLSHFNRSRQLLFTIKLRYKDLEKVELVVDEMRRSLARRAGVDRRLPQFVGMSGFQDYAINIVVLVHTTPVASRDWGNFRQRLLMDFGRIINKHAVQFAYPTQVTHMPHLEEAILNSVSKQQGEGSEGSNGASRPPSPQTQGAGLEIEQSHTGAPIPTKVMAQQAAQALGNEAHSSHDLF